MFVIVGVVIPGDNGTSVLGLASRHSFQILVGKLGGGRWGILISSTAAAVCGRTMDGVSDRLLRPFRPSPFVNREIIRDDDRLRVD